jgi:hypothetical protein
MYYFYLPAHSDAAADHPDLPTCVCYMRFPDCLSYPCFRAGVQRVIAGSLEKADTGQRPLGRGICEKRL